MKQTTDLILGLRSSSAGLLPKGSKNRQPDATSPIGTSHCHKDSQHHSSATSLLRRALLVLTLLVGWGTSVVGQTEVELPLASSGNQASVTGANLKSFLPSGENINISVRVYTEDKGLANFNAGWGNTPVLKSGATSIPSGSDYYKLTDLCYEIPLSDFKDNFPNYLEDGNSLFIQVGQWGNQSVTKISY